MSEGKRKIEERKNRKKKRKIDENYNKQDGRGEKTKDWEKFKSMEKYWYHSSAVVGGGDNIGEKVSDTATAKASLISFSKRAGVSKVMLPVTKIVKKKLGLSMPSSKMRHIEWEDSDSFWDRLYTPLPFLCPWTSSNHIWLSRSYTPLVF